MDETNPYAAPTAETTLAASESWQGLWRDKRDLVMHKDSKLPNVLREDRRANDSRRGRQKVVVAQPVARVGDPDQPDRLRYFGLGPVEKSYRRNSTLGRSKSNTQVQSHVLLVSRFGVVLLRCLAASSLS